ncbi:MAG: hypothetical protein ACXWUX_15700, partial [Allosphingosinicella sp.]
MDLASYQILTGPTGPTVALAGDWTSLTLGDEAIGLRAALLGTPGTPNLDLAGVGRLDTAGAYAILRAMPPGSAATSARPEFARLFELVRPAVEEEAPPARGGAWLISLFEHIGRGLYAFADEAWRAAV